ncbi:MAG: hypothetical protein HPZ77_10065 [Acidaminococcaceae bacterium]|nr:hypothetical protein [Acidaminococcaceae bacterium]
MPKKKTALTIEERLQQALVSAEEQPYEVPENWVWVRLGSLADVKGGKRLPKGTTFSENITKHPYIRVTDFNAIGVSLEGLKYIDEDVYEKISRYTISSDDIYVSIAGSIGKVGIIPSCIDGANLTENAAKITNIKGINQKYLCLFLKSEFAQYQMQSATIATTQAKLALFRIESLTFPLPPLSEQQRIVERIEELFAKLDEAKERLQEVADSFAVRKAGILHKAFTGELTKQWRRENGVSDESWEEKKLSEITENQDSKRIPLSKSQRDNMNRIYDYYGASGIIDKVDDYIFEGKKLLIGEDGANLVTRSKDIAFIADGKYWVNNHAHILDVKDTVLLMYLCHYINNMDLIPYVTGSAQPKLTQAKMNNIKIFLPTLSEQHEIVRLIDDLLARERAAQQATEQALVSIDLMKKSILARALRGELGTNKASEASALELLKQVLAEN